MGTEEVQEVELRLTLQTESRRIEIISPSRTLSSPLRLDFPIFRKFGLAFDDMH